ncbi:hypothetical protein C9374_002147 [Naegleria lovaniensis]|uniref:Signal recognition particle receptor subunit beta n=1 Tax=Naegleria lovaniensis TaxID=51637 RepID=A0AA88GQQ2_NAELO|nr:uncharacterized protein C9374_002147 [Naegleria lovaniensis]KAG2387112.1 hypothetical protein C9374_002147 [Naegleria lovaniensis]
MNLLILAAILLVMAVAGFVVARILMKNMGLRRGNALMIIGLSDSGKTCLFYKLKDGKVARTQTSVKENYGKFVPKLIQGMEKEIEVVDIPGHSRVRQQLMNQYLPITKKIIYVLDASDFNASTNAEFLYDILTNRKLIDQYKPASLTIICNKADIAFYVKNHMKRELEKELTTIHNTKKHQHQSIDEDATTAPYPLMESKEFSFESWSTFRNIPINFEFCSVTKENDETFIKVMETVVSDL